jgi:hypothetical protein
VRGIVLDPEILAAGILGRARPRRLLGLLAYGRWSEYAHLLGPAEEALIREETGNRGQRGGPSTDEMIELATNRTAALQEVLPYGPPNDLVLVTSTRIHDAVVDRMQLARESEPALRGVTDIEDRARRILAFLSAVIVGDIGGDYGRYETLRDELVYVAATTSSPLVTDDSFLAPRDGRMWRHTASVGGRPAFAVTFWTFVDDHIDEASAGLDDVPYNLLELAMRPWKGAD